MHLPVDPQRLALWATRHGLLSPDGDYGYALHALLHSAFGEQAPQPFVYQGPAQGLLAFSGTDRDTLRRQAALATPDVAAALGLGALEARPFPERWPRGHRLAFEVRVRPVVRARNGREAERERDAFLHAIEGTTLPDANTTADEQGALARREAVYRDWLAHGLATDGAAKLIEASMDAFRLTRVLRKGVADEGGRRRPRGIAGPDVRFRGQLQVTDEDAFARMLARGIGRHRAFGFGMLLLRPA